jgi:hypothetical protein
MAVSLPYLPSNKNVPVLFEKIESAKVPDTFNREFLQTTIGLKGSNDRALIPLLRNLGFIDQSNVPTPSYRLLKGDRKKAALAAGIRKAYAALFDADQDAHKAAGEKLKSLISQVAGTDDDITGRIAGTFSSLAKLGTFEGQPTPTAEAVDVENKSEVKDATPDTDSGSQARDRAPQRGLRTEFHYNIQVHLPSNGTEEIYLNIFNALRKTFQ